MVVHTFDRWSRNLRVMLESMGVLAQNGVGLVSITENIDYSTPHGKMATPMLGSVAEFSSVALATHVKKGIGERARQGLHLGSLPFSVTHPAGRSPRENAGSDVSPSNGSGIHIHLEERRAVKELFGRYASGTVTLATLASWLNDQGFRTRNRHRLPDGQGNQTTESRLFTIASVRGATRDAAGRCIPTGARVPAQGPYPLRPLPYAHVGPDLRERTALLP